MANNPYVNKVVYGNQTLIDISDTTAAASDVAQGKYFYLNTGQKVQGSASTGSIVISDTTDTHGGTIRTITTGQTVNLQTKTITPTSSQQTVTPDTGYTGFSEVIVEASSGGGGYITQDQDGYIVLSPTNGVPTLINKTITESGTYDPADDGATGYSSVTVNISSMNIDTKTITSSSDSSSISFTGLSGRPLQFFVWFSGAYQFWADTNYYIMVVRYNGSSTYGGYLRPSGGNYQINTANYGFSYNNGNLTIFTSTSVTDANGGGFLSGQYELTYVY